MQSDAWVGHLIKMEDIRVPKQLFYGDLLHGRRPRHKLKKCFKDITKNNSEY